MKKMVDYGYIERTHGLKGRLIIRLFVLGPAVPLEAGTVLVAGDRKLTVTRSRKRDNQRITLDCSELRSVEEADALRGASVSVAESSVLRDGFPVPVYSFEGFTICSGEKSYSIRKVEFNSSNPQLIVQGEDSSFPVPVNMAMSGEINMEKRTITLQLPEGMEEL
ncbi:hypothetical protein CSA37_09560 [Candidatus Fermentibacteria bacterium]|nr:MAG: hypothetical protein CSA37_09560 [Candidatus Fermentibacteria bacterium]